MGHRVKVCMAAGLGWSASSETPSREICFASSGACDPSRECCWTARLSDEAIRVSDLRAGGLRLRCKHELEVLSCVSWNRSCPRRNEARGTAEKLDLDLPLVPPAVAVVRYRYRYVINTY